MMVKVRPSWAGEVQVRPLLASTGGGLFLGDDDRAVFRARLGGDPRVVHRGSGAQLVDQLTADTPRAQIGAQRGTVETGRHSAKVRRESGAVKGTVFALLDGRPRDKTLVK